MAELTALGKPLALLDLMIAAHALAENATLITFNRALAKIYGLAIQDGAQVRPQSPTTSSPSAENS